MKLLHFAHAPEAQCFISHFNLIAKGKLYIGEDIIVQICGEGLYDSLFKLSETISKYPIDSIINIGIAGSLTKDLDVDSIISIKTVYAFNEKNPKFNSYSTSDTNSDYDCISAELRALNKEYAEKLVPFAQVVDRELWSVGKVAKYYKIPFSSIKLISDYALEEVHCLDIKDKAREYSEKLLSHYLNTSPSTNESSEIDMKYPFEMSHYLKKKYEKLIKKLLMKSHDDAEHILSKSKLNEIAKMDIKDKDKAQLLISNLEEMLNPIEKIVRKKMDVLFKPLYENNIDLHIDPKLEIRKFKVSKEINSQKNIDDMILALKELNFKNIEDFWKGDLDV